MEELPSSLVLRLPEVADILLPGQSARVFMQGCSPGSSQCLQAYRLCRHAVSGRDPAIRILCRFEDAKKPCLLQEQKAGLNVVRYLWFVCRPSEEAAEVCDLLFWEAGEEYGDPEAEGDDDHGRRPAWW